MSEDELSQAQNAARATQLDGKIDLVNAKVDALRNETKAGFESMRQVSDEHWKGLDMRLDASAREIRQQMEFLTTNTSRLQSDYDRVSRDMSVTDLSVGAVTVQMSKLEDEVTALKERNQWTVRTLGVTVLGVLAYVFDQYITHIHH